MSVKSDLRERAIDEILSLTEEEVEMVIRAWEIFQKHPELAPEECAMRAMEQKAAKSVR